MRIQEIFRIYIRWTVSMCEGLIVERGVHSLNLSYDKKMLKRRLM
jgi:hypothetical protein